MRMNQDLIKALEEKGVYVYDLEFKQRRIKYENEPHMIAVRYSGGKSRSIVLIEVKSKRKACKDETSGLTHHLEGMNNYISAFKSLKLQNSPETIPNLESIKEFEMMVILINTAVDYYNECKYIIHEYIKEKKYKCEIMEWTDAKTLNQLFKN